MSGFLFSPGDSEQALAHIKWKNPLYPAIFLLVSAVVAEKSLDMGEGGIYHTFSCEMIEYFSAH